VPQRLRQQVKRKLYLTCHPRSRIARLSAVARLATASAVHILLRNYVIQNQNIAQLCTVLQRLRQRVKRTFYLGNMSSRTKILLSYVPCRNTCDSE
jgi:hypothetical protein